MGKQSPNIFDADTYQHALAPLPTSMVRELLRDHRNARKQEMFYEDILLILETELENRSATPGFFKKILQVVGI